jgi:hypothetical protein
MYSGLRLSVSGADAHHAGLEVIHGIMPYILVPLESPMTETPIGRLGIRSLSILFREFAGFV